MENVEIPNNKIEINTITSSTESRQKFLNSLN